MTRPWVRLALVCVGLAAIVAGGWTIWSFESHARESDASLRLAGESARKAIGEAADLRAAQQAYVAVGQGQDFWFARVTALSTELDEVLSVFKRHLTSPEAFAAAGEAASALQDFQQVDARARELALAHETAQASDVIFADGFEMSQKIAAGVSRALTADMVAAEAVRAHDRRLEATVAGASAAVTALILILLVPGVRAAAAESSAATESPAVVSKETLDDLTDFGVVSWPSPAQVPPPAAVDLPAIASLCSDFARITDTNTIPALLERAAGLLDAEGIVLWIADPDGRELSPIVVHGYPPQIAGRLGTIHRDATNVTASAFRTGLLQTVKSDAVSNGAVAAPLVSASGCLGVMAVEMKNGGEQREPLLAAATILASQLSTLVGPPSARARAEVAG